MAATSSATCVKQVFVHPVALFTIVDSYERRNEDAKRVVGTLLGSFNNGIVEVKSCFTVPHIETQEEVAFDKEYASSMLELHKAATPQEEVVGWFATSHDVTGHSTLIHEYYSIECGNPIHLTLDTQLKTGSMSMKSYVSSPMGVPGGTMGIIFTPVPSQIKSYKPETVAVESFARNKGGSKKPSELLGGVHQISSSTDHIVEKLNNALQYVNEVIEGKAVANSDIGHKLLSIISAVPQMDPAQIEKMMNNNMQDLLMVLYLASLTKTQLSVGTRLNSII